MKKSIALAILGLMFTGGMTKSYAQEDSAKVAEEPKDTISIDKMDPVFYEEETTKESSYLVFYIVLGVTGLVGLLLIPLFTLIDILRSKFEGNRQLIWVLVLIFFNILGVILYFFIGRKQKIHEHI